MDLQYIRKSLAGKTSFCCQSVGVGKIGDEGVNHVGTDFVRVKRVCKSGGDKMMSHLGGWGVAGWRGVSPHNVDRSHSSLPSVLPTARSPRRICHPIHQSSIST